MMEQIVAAPAAGQAGPSRAEVLFAAVLARASSPKARDLLLKQAAVTKRLLLLFPPADDGQIPRGGVMAAHAYALLAGGSMSFQQAHDHIEELAFRGFVERRGDQLHLKPRAQAWLGAAGHPFERRVRDAAPAVPTGSSAAGASWPADAHVSVLLRMGVDRGRGKHRDSGKFWAQVGEHRREQRLSHGQAATERRCVQAAMSAFGGQVWIEPEHREVIARLVSQVLRGSDGARASLPISARPWGWSAPSPAT